MDLIIKVQLFHHRNNSIETVATKHKANEREKPRQQYHFNCQQVCRGTFAFAHAVSRKPIDSIAQSLDKDGLVARTHGNKGKSPKYALTVQDVQKQFLVNYAQQLQYRKICLSEFKSIWLEQCP